MGRISSSRCQKCQGLTISPRIATSLKTLPTLMQHSLAYRRTKPRKLILNNKLCSRLYGLLSRMRAFRLNLLLAATPLCTWVSIPTVMASSSSKTCPALNIPWASAQNTAEYLTEFRTFSICKDLTLQSMRHAQVFSSSIVVE